VISRYGRPALRELFAEASRFGFWLEVELAHMETLERAGVAAPGSTAAARTKAKIDPARIDDLERELNHDVVAFLTAVTEHLGEERTWLHFGMTSTDLVDTAQALQLREASRPILASLDAIGVELRRRALEHRDTVMVGRTHGVHAEPTSFGFKLLGWYAELGRQKARLTSAFQNVAVGKLSGAVGTSVHLPPAYEEETLARLGLAVEPVATQVLPRDRHAELLSAVANLAGSLERFALEIRHLQRTEVREAEEPFGRGQKGSSSMPHKRNPILCERICGLARVLRGNALAAYENMALWHERDISHSSVERVILPDSLTLLDYLLDRFRFVLEGLSVFPERMRENLESSAGLVYSQRVLLALTDAMKSREAAYRVVQSHAMRIWGEGSAWRAGGSFLDRLAADPEVTAHLGREELAALFDPRHYLRHLDRLYQRTLSVQWEVAS